jgi:hypothetical protein
MARAEWLDAARQYLFEAKNGLEGAARSLSAAGFPGSADTAQDLHKGAEALHFEIRLAAAIAHRAENPEAYDESGRWVGRRGATEKEHG